MNRAIAILIGAALLGSAGASALTVLNFEGLPSTYYFYGGNTNLGNYYSGVTFGAQATILDRVIYGYNDYGFPPHSGDAVLYTDVDPIIRADFDSPVGHVGLWYTIGYDSGLWLEAYDSGDNLLASAWGGANLYTTSFLSIDAVGIDYVKLHDFGNSYTIDDFEYDGGQEPIPEPASLLLLGPGLGVVAFIRHRRRAA